jgi:hypothetical protein
MIGTAILSGAAISAPSAFDTDAPIAPRMSHPRWNVHESRPNSQRICRWDRRILLGWSEHSIRLNR